MGKAKEKKSGIEFRPAVRRHSVWDNYRVAFSWMREIEGTAYFFLQGMEIVLAVIQPFLAMALPGAVVYLLGSGREPGKIFPALAGYVLALQGMYVVRGYLRGWCKRKQMCFRLKLGTQLFGASMEADYQLFENQSGQKMLNDAMWNLYYGNDRGIEAFLRVLGDFMRNLMGLILYSVVIGSRSPGILILSLSVTGVAAGIHAYAHKRAEKYDEKYEKDIEKECVGAVVKKGLGLTNSDMAKENILIEKLAAWIDSLSLNDLRCVNEAEKNKR